MKTRIHLWAILFLMSTSLAFSQIDRNRSLAQFRLPNQFGAAQFEALGDRDVEFDGVNVRVGGGFAIQYQALSHESSGLNYDTIGLATINNNFNLPTANLDLDVALAKGVRMHLRTYLSARHHPEAWVKGGYIQISSLDFIEEDFLSGVMDLVTVKVGLMEINYGDYHFRRTDNARAIYNPFVGNLIMDAFTTEVGAEVYVTPGDFLIMAGITNGNLNQSVIGDGENQTPAIVGKVGWDSQVSDDLRTRLTASIYTTAEGQRVYLYGGDRAGSRYYMVMEPELFRSRSGQLSGPDYVAQYTSGRWNPDLTAKNTSIMINPYVRWKGLEFFGTFETASGRNSRESADRSWTQLHGELLYYFFEKQNVYIGGKYNSVSGELVSSGADVSINRLAFAAGWYMTKNVMLKAEYVTQTYNDFPANGAADFNPNYGVLNEGKFDGIVMEATINF
jgi:hypothetical protein